MPDLLGFLGDVLQGLSNFLGGSLFDTLAAVTVNVTYLLGGNVLDVLGAIGL